MSKTKIALAVTGSVAAYKAAELARRLMDERLSVHVAMTANAEKFITPLTFAALTGNHVLRHGYPAPGDDPMPHITFQRGASLILVAPATANIIGKLANGIADDMLSSMLIASDAPVLVAPSMNSNMYNHPSVRKNIETLKRRGVSVIGPATGELACGETGEGKMERVENIVTKVLETLDLGRDLLGRKILVTAGGAREPIDPVRFIGNRSSGKMGVAVAQAAESRGADVTLVAGAMEIPVPEDMETIYAPTALEMMRVVKERFADSDVLVMAAAVGDYRARSVSPVKIREKESWDLALVRNPDIIARMCASRNKRIVVGFAAETDNAEKSGREKLLRKNMDMIVVNDVSREDIGFGSDCNEVVIITRSGETVRPPKMSKTEIGKIIIDLIADMLIGKHGDRDLIGGNG